MENTTAAGKREKSSVAGIKPQRIVIVQTAFIGDVILAEPFIARTKAAFPDARIDVVVIPSAANVLETHPAIDQLIVFDKRGVDRGLKGFLRLLWRLKTNCYTMAMVPHRSFRSALLVWLANIPVRIGFRNSAGFFFFNRRVNYLQAHEVERNLSLLNALEIFSGYQKPEIYTTRDDEQKVSSLLANLNRISAIDRETPAIKNGRIHSPLPAQNESAGNVLSKITIALAPGSVWETKKWPEEKYRQLGQRLAKAFGCRIVLIGGENDRELCERLAGNIGRACRSFAGKLSLRESAALLKRCDILVSNDSAPAHLGVAAGCRVVTIFGATVPRFGFYPRGNTHRMIETPLDLPCRPCGSHGGKKCPIKTFDCMHSISVETVFSAIRSMIRSKKQNAKIRRIVDGANRDDIAIAVQVLKENGVLVMPTETLYALVASAQSQKAVEKIFALKFRAKSSPLPLICSSLQQVKEFCLLEGLAYEIAQEFWPGPLTLVLPARSKLPRHILAKDGTVAVRVPASAFCREVAESLEGAITATSANISGDEAAQGIKALPSSIKQGVDFIFDGGKCASSLPSTIIKISGIDIQVLRRGIISTEKIYARTGVSSVE
jgi:heptosyltransferase-2